MINKKWAYALGLASLSTAMVAADQAQQTTQPPMPMGVTSQPSGVITPPVAPRVTNGADVYLTADFIYWKAYQEGLGYAISGENNYSTDTPFGPETTGQTLTRGHEKSAASHFQPGFKVGFGLEFEHDGWDLFAQYTWLNPATKHNSIKDVNGNTLFGTTATNYAGWITGYGASFNGLSQASSSHRLSYNVLDVEMGRNFFVSRYMTLRPHFGLKSAWLTQSFSSNYSFNPNYTASPETETSSIYSESVHQSQRSWGLGIRAGLDPVFHFTRCWGMYGNLALSAMYTYYKDRLNDTLYNQAGTVATQVQRVTASHHTVTPVLEMGLGLTYMTWFYDESYMFDVRAGWEEQVWFGNNQFLNTDQTHSSNGNLSFQGFTLKFGFHF